jgi:hypothetical protein
MTPFKKSDVGRKIVMLGFNGDTIETVVVDFNSGPATVRAPTTIPGVKC